MQLLYNSDSFTVVQIDVPTQGEIERPDHPTEHLRRGGYEIVDKFARKEIFIEGLMAQHFKAGVEALIETSPSEDEMDEYLGRFTSLMQQPVVLH